MPTLVESEPYQQVIDACRANDRTRLFRIIDEQLTGVDGAERAFWLRTRAINRARDAMLPQVQDLAWADLEEALCAAPDDQMPTLVTAFGVAVTGERNDRLLTVLRAIRGQFRAMSQNPFYWQDSGFLSMVRGRWHKAVVAFTRAIDAFGHLPPGEQASYSCRLAHFHAWRAICLVACGETDPAAADVETALDLAAGHPPKHVNHLALGMARAELALQLGKLQDARAALQHGIMQDNLLKRPRPLPAHMAQTELLAARIARAEGNLVSFEHFCQKSLAVCRQYHLPLTEVRVRAVLAGEPR